MVHDNDDPWWILVVCDVDAVAHRLTYDGAIHDGEHLASLTEDLPEATFSAQVTWQALGHPGLGDT